MACVLYLNFLWKLGVWKKLLLSNGPLSTEMLLAVGLLSGHLDYSESGLVPNWLMKTSN